MTAKEDRAAELAQKVERAHAEIARLCDGGRWRMTVPVDPKRDSDLILTDALDALSAARPAPVVSTEAVERATTRLIESGEVPIPWDANPRDYVQDAIAGVLAALGLTATDTPAADDEGGR